jgi:hypothetical protein
MRTFRSRMRSLSTLCLASLLCVALVQSETQTPMSETSGVVSQRAQAEPMPADEYQKLWTEVLNSARSETQPKIRNPGLSTDVLALDVASALREQRSYLERNGIATGTALSATTLASYNSKGASTSQHSDCHRPVIRSVNGKTKGVIFTPVASNNVYKIEGCSFGDAAGIVQLEAHKSAHQGALFRPIIMQLDTTSIEPWTDNELRVRLDARLRGLPDYPVTLVIYSSKRRRIELQDCRFVAARGDPQLLSVIPSAWVSLYPSGVGSRSIRQLEYVSPTQAVGNFAKDATASAFVIRSDREQFGIGEDSYDFSHLNSGWVVEAVQLQTYHISCPGPITSSQSLGSWEIEWTPLGLSVAFGKSTCTASAKSSPALDLSLSQYAIKVWIVGPVGTEPLASIQ